MCAAPPWHEQYVSRPAHPARPAGQPRRGATAPADLPRPARMLAAIGNPPSEAFREENRGDVTVGLRLPASPSACAGSVSIGWSARIAGRRRQPLREIRGQSQRRRYFRSPCLRSSGPDCFPPAAQRSHDPPLRLAPPMRVRIKVEGSAAGPDAGVLTARGSVRAVAVAWARCRSCRTRARRWRRM
jgi:hypothetical protein